MAPTSILKYHIVWCPKYRLKVLTGEVDTRIRELLIRKASSIGVTIETMEIMPDHVHLFVSTDNSTMSPAKIAHQLKGFTSHELRKEFKVLRSRMPTLWSRSFYVGTVGHISEEVVRKYIESQKGR